MNAEKALARAERQSKYVNQYAKDNYDRVNLLLPKGTKDRIAQTGESMNSFVKKLIEAELERLGL